ADLRFGRLADPGFRGLGFWGYRRDGVRGGLCFLSHLVSERLGVSLQPVGASPLRTGIASTAAFLIPHPIMQDLPDHSQLMMAHCPDRRIVLLRVPPTDPLVARFEYRVFRLGRRVACLRQKPSHVLVPFRRSIAAGFL